MLRLSSSGDILIYSFIDGKLVKLLNIDIMNCLFENIVIDENFTIRSFFEMVIQYPTLIKPFQMLDSYIQEYSFLRESPVKNPNKIAVITFIHSIREKMICHHEDLKIYRLDDRKNPLQESLGTMQIQDFLDYFINFNELTAIDKFDEEANKYTEYMEFSPYNGTLTLLNFVKIVINEIGRYGFPDERNLVIKEQIQEQKKREDAIMEESMKITQNILKKITSGDSND